MPTEKTSPLSYPPPGPDAARPMPLPEMPTSPEMALLLTCLRWPRDAATQELTTLRAHVVQDWNFFVALAMRHRVSALAAYAMREAGLLPPPALHAAATKAGLGELSLAGELRSLQTSLRNANIRPLVLKGLPLSVRAFGRLGLRYNRDIDLLVPKADIQAAAVVLREAGYRRIEPAETVSEHELRRWLKRQKDFVFLHPVRNQIVEIHWRLFDNPHLLRIAEDGQCSQTAITSDFIVETLPAEFDLIFACVHGAHHAWSRLKWLADINALLARMTAPQMLALQEAAQNLHVGRATAQAMLLSARLLGRPIPSGIVAQALTDWRLRAMERLAYRGIFFCGATELEESAFGSTVKNITHYLLVDSLPYQLSEALFDLTDLTDENIDNLPSYLIPFVRFYGWTARHIGGRSKLPAKARP